MEYMAKTGANLWSMSSVLELYKLSGWRLVMGQLLGGRERNEEAVRAHG